MMYRLALRVQFRCLARAELSFRIPHPFSKYKNAERLPPGWLVVFFYGVLNRGLANSSGDAVSGCSAFQRIAAVIRVRPLG
jgi:hypothetical protein